MSPFSAAVLLLLLSGTCVGHWRRWDHHRQPWQRWRDAGDKTPTPLLQCTGNKEPVPCGELNATDVNRLCPVYEDESNPMLHKRKPRCGRWDERRGGRCACRTPLWVGERGTCVPKEQCPTCDTATEVFNDCGTLCEGKCGKVTRYCWMMCAAPACACKWGYKRDRASGKCVAPDECPVAHWQRGGDYDHRRQPWQHWHNAVDTTPTPRQQCAADERYSRCRAHPLCQLTCDRPLWRMCPRICQQGCVCKRSLVRDEAAGGKCVTRDQCSAPKPIECTGNKVPVLCGKLNETNVNRYCPMYETSHGHKSKQHLWHCSGSDERRVALCACKLPNRIDLNHNCMPVDKCPTCGANEVYSSCGPRCWPSCSWPKVHRSRDCKSYKWCKPGCVCKEGYLHDKESRTCVPENECSNMKRPEARARSPWSG